MREPYPSRCRRAADGEEGRGPGGVGEEDEERRGGGFQTSTHSCTRIINEHLLVSAGPCCFALRGHLLRYSLTLIWTTGCCFALGAAFTPLLSSMDKTKLVSLRLSHIFFI
jgi:hypothetical protein